MQHPKTASAIRAQMQQDLKLRSSSGIYIYLIIWIVLAIGGHIYELSPIIFALNTLIFIMTSCARYYIHRNGSSDPHVEHSIITGLILFSALHWGIMSSWLVYSHEFSHTKWLVLLTLASVAIGGVAIFNIFRFLGTLYPLLIITPSIITGLFIHTDYYNFLLVLSAILMAFVVYLCNTVNGSYLKKLHAHHATVKRADEMQLLSTTDPVTGLNNRLSFSDQFKIIWHNHLQSSQPVSLLYIDLDHFKQINDQYSHLAGDACLKAVGNVFKKTILQDDYVIARYGGEEFTILMPNTTLEMATKVADELNAAVKNMVFKWSNQRVRVTCSIGIASLIPTVDTERITLIEMADKALYQAKSAGRNQSLSFQAIT